jgi:UTP--glucose-1-phosphate uridylyltransferase
MLPIVDKPLIQYAIEEAMEAGINEFILVTGEDKGSIENHFRSAVDLEQQLVERGKKELLEIVNPVAFDDISIKSVIQQKPLGLGHAVLCTRELVDNQPFAILLPDDLIDNDHPGCMKQMVDIYNQYQSGVIAVENVPYNETDKYGIVSTEQIDSSINKITAIVEKPKPEEAPSTLAVVGRYILPPVIFDYLGKIEEGSGDEIQLTDAIAQLLHDEMVIAYEFRGKRYDCGSKLGYLQANVEYGLKHPEIKSEFLKYLNQLKD